MRRQLIGDSDWSACPVDGDVERGLELVVAGSPHLLGELGEPGVHGGVDGGWEGAALMSVSESGEGVSGGLPGDHIDSPPKVG
jgi:hypothetical protein